MSTGDDLAVPLHALLHQPRLRPKGFLRIAQHPSTVLFHPKQVVDERNLDSFSPQNKINNPPSTEHFLQSPLEHAVACGSDIQGSRVAITLFSHLCSAGITVSSYRSRSLTKSSPGQAIDIMTVEMVPGHPFSVC